ncbi:MAG: DNA polymerase III subunit delta' [Nitrospirae bacterium]|nr:DNA polymerase III subunit delta' [Nitrospirota bacterium]
MALRDVIGQERAVHILRGCIARERVPHALLFAGDDGIGKKLTALNFAKALNCTGGQGPGARGQNETLFEVTDHRTLDPGPRTLHDSCDQCSSCLKIEKLFDPESLILSGEDEKSLKEKIYVSHPDVALITPYKDEIRIEVIRKLEEALTYKPFEGRYKIAIIDNADTMNNSASNAFLKTLESPPGQSILILISSRPDMLLPTIRSRCRRINFNPLPFHVMSALLREKSGKYDEGRSLLLSALSGGRPGCVLNEDLIAQRDRFFASLKRLSDSVDEEEKGDIDELLEWAQVWLRDLAVFKATGRADLLINSDREGEIKALVQGAALKGILKLAQEIYNIRVNTRFNLNEKLTRNYTGLLIRKRLGRLNAGK